MKQREKSNRRRFFGLVAKGAAALGLTSIFTTYAEQEKFEELNEPTEEERWLSKLTGKHKIVFDSISVRGFLLR